ncbi:MAG: HAMP domain-containing protein [Candidatus Desulforudis sp.]|nr:HAMP domain-containing protein [Desulforudis sp.]
MSSIFGRLFGSYLIVILITLATVHLAVSYLFADYYYAAREKEMLQEAENLAQSLAESDPEAADLVFGRNLNGTGRISERLAVLERRQIELGPYGRGPGRHNWLAAEESSRILAGEPAFSRRFLPSLEQDVLQVAVPIHRNGQVSGAVLIFAPVADLDATVAAVRRITLSAAAVAVFLAAGLSFWLSRSLSDPLREMSRVSVEMARGDFSRRVTVNRRDEVGQLAENLNHLAGSLDRSVGELAREKGKLESVVANMAEGVLAVDSKGRVILANAPARNTLSLGTDTADAVNQPVPVPELTALYNEVLATGDRRSTELELNGTSQSVQCSPLRHQDGTVFGAVAVLQDITALRELERMRRDFVANVSHELRTPLTAVQGIVEGLIDGVISEDDARERYLQVAHRETLRMNRLVQDLLDLAALEAGRTDWELHAVDIGDVLTRVETRLQANLAEKELTERSELPANLPPLLANENRLEQVLTNLIENAVRFSPPGGEILVTALKRPENRVTVAVQDRGPGIPPADLPHLWDRFYRVEKSRARDLGGTGLGLAIVKQIVEAQGGEVGVESTPGEGATFWFTLPVASEGDH